MAVVVLMERSGSREDGVARAPHCSLFPFFPEEYSGRLLMTTASMTLAFKDFFVFSYRLIMINIGIRSKKLLISDEALIKMWQIQMHQCTLVSHTHLSIHAVY